MSAAGAIELELHVDCSPEHAFDVFTTRTTSWWPRGHTRSGDPAAVTVEPRVGGRIFERAADGTEYDWGEVTAWEPPGRLAYLWHIASPRERATEVDIRFEPDGEGTTMRLTQSGFERLGAEGERLRERNRHGWGVMFEAFAEALRGSPAT